MACRAGGSPVSRQMSPAEVVTFVPAWRESLARSGGFGIVRP